MSLRNKHTAFFSMLYGNSVVRVKWSVQEPESYDLLLLGAAAASLKKAFIRYMVSCTGFPILPQLFYLKCYWPSSISISYFCSLLSPHLPVI